MRTLSREQARRVYDRIGSWQDTQAFYEDRAVGELLRLAQFERARRVFEFGCGTGRFAETILTDFLPAGASYRGMDVSPTMVGLTSQRLLPFSARVEVTLSDGGAPAREAGEPPDRFVGQLRVGSAFRFGYPRRARRRPSHARAPGTLVPDEPVICAALVLALHPRLLVATALDSSRSGGGMPPAFAPRPPVRRDTGQLEEEVRVVQFGVPSQVVIASRI